MTSRVYICLFAAFSLANAIPTDHENGNVKNIYGITGGQSADIEDYPYTASIYVDDVNTLAGNGAIVDKNWIVCPAYGLTGITPRYLTARVGSSNAGSGGQVVNITKTIKHPNYHIDYPYDIELMKTETPINLGKTAKVVKLASKTPAAGTQAKLTAFGKSEDGSGNPLDLKVVSVNVLSQDECRKQHPSLDDTSFCAHSDTAGPCKSDFGAPLVSKNQLIGIYTGGDICNFYGEPEIYTNVAVLAPWIKDIIKHN